MQRFELVKEPMETWAVFDTALGVPAEENGKVLIGLTSEEAGLALFRLNVGLVRSLLLQRSR
jgi:hypothetical protein